MQIRKAGIILKKDSEETQRIGRELVFWLSERSIATELDSITPDLDILIILGGDGTLLHVADRASELQIPVVGVNLGSLGFLTEVGVEERYEALEAILDGSVCTEERFMLKVRMIKGGAPEPWRLALNDVVISKGSLDQLVRLRTWADSEHITTYRADGLIFSTPTGSTAYNLSAGGPIVHPDLKVLLVTPICPFMLESRPVLLPATACLRTELAGSAAPVKIIVDGQYAWDMDEECVLDVRAADKPLLLVSSPQKGYFDILARKLNWGGRRTD